MEGLGRRGGGASRDEKSGGDPGWMRQPRARKGDPIVSQRRAYSSIPQLFLLLPLFVRTALQPMTSERRGTRAETQLSLARAVAGRCTGHVPAAAFSEMSSDSRRSLGLSYKCVRGESQPSSTPRRECELTGVLLACASTERAEIRTNPLAVCT